MGRRVKRISAAVVPALLTAAIYFAIAGRTDLPAAWSAFAVLLAVSVASVTLIDPDLIRERRNPGPGGTDLRTARLGRALGPLVLVFAALDVGRLHLSDGVPLGLAFAGVVAWSLGMGFAVWALAVNPYFSSVVRLQTDRGHRAITRGPYAIVRHPGYAGMCLALPGIGLALGSWIGTLALASFVPLLLRRIPLEERLLGAELEGYADYMRRVRWRMLPGVW